MLDHVVHSFEYCVGFGKADVFSIARGASGMRRQAMYVALRLDAGRCNAARTTAMSSEARLGAPGA